MSALIPAEEYFNILSQAKLTCVDLIFKNTQGQVLLGYRNNKPAQGTWFVPGGAVRKHEGILEAVGRVTRNEIGTGVTSSEFYAIAEHNYPDNFADKEGVESNFIVLAFSCVLESEDFQEDAQHEALKWWDILDLLASPEVHPFTKAYFHPDPDPSVIIIKTGKGA